MAKPKTVFRAYKPIGATPARMKGADAVFAELEAMTRRERKEIAARLLEWIEENDLA